MTPAGRTVDVVALDDRTARAVGPLCGAADVADVVDASVVLCARERRQRVVTSDPDDRRRIDPHLAITTV